MADNYIEKKMEEFKAMPPAGMALKNSRKPATTLSKLVAANKLCKSFNNKIIVREQHLKNLIEFASEYTPGSASTNYNSAELQYYPTVNAGEVSTILDFLKNQNPELLNFETPGLLPKSFILIGCNTCNESCNYNELHFLLGAVANIITLRATEMGLNGTYTILSGQTNLQNILKLSFAPLVAIAIGKGE